MGMLVQRIYGSVVDLELAPKDHLSIRKLEVTGVIHALHEFFCVLFFLTVGNLLLVLRSVVDFIQPLIELAETLTLVIFGMQEGCTIVSRV